LRVAAVQGDSDAGLFAEYEPGQILDDHLAATEPLYGEDIDLLVWPENASDLDPLRSARSSAALDRVTEQAGAALIVGTITADGDDIYNSLLLWREGSSPLDQYDKLHPVPFAEYIPDRDFWYPLAPDLLSLIPRDYSIGTRDNVFDIDGAATAGVAICFDIVDDNLVRQMIAGGADIIIAPTNNADFGRTDESVQQLAIARLRAIETGRSVVNASTVGTSAIIAPDGSTLDRLPTFTPDTMLQDVPLSTTTTPATVVGQGIEFAVSLLALLGLAITGLLTRRRRTSEGNTRG
jgi:apolipoprotein N-acyltransferase